MKSLTGRWLSNFNQAFHAESDRPPNEVWALSEEQRLYYQISSYLFGIHPHPLTTDLASFARVLETRPERRCAEYLKSLIQEKVAPICHAKGATRIGAALTKGGRRVFVELQAILPGVFIEDGYPYDFGRIELS